MDKCPKCDKEIDLREMEIHEKKRVVCAGCGTRWEVTMHGDGALFDEVKETPLVEKAEKQIEGERSLMVEKAEKQIGGEGSLRFSPSRKGGR